MERPRHARPRGATKKSRQSDRTKQRLVAAARKLFEEHGYHRVSVTEIAKAAGVTHGMINAHFNAKAGLLYAMIDESNAEQIEATREAAKPDGTVLERLRRVMEVYASRDLRDRELLAVMQAYFWEWPDETEAHNRAQLAEALKIVATILEDGKASAEIRDDLDTDLAVRTIFAIYTLGLRPAVYDGATVADCVDGIMEQVTLLLEGMRA